MSPKKIYRRFLKIRGRPREIALGFSLGILIGMSPFMGLQTAIAVFFAALLKWNKLSAALGIWITNPATAPFIYGSTYLIGAKLIGIRKAYQPVDEFTFETTSNLFQRTPEILWALVLGGIIIGLPLSVIGYFFSYSAILKYQQNLKKRLERKKKGRLGEENALKSAIEK
jgi:uncharacterized protein (DUF2062 family)